jgi:hypothetical protein
MEDQLFADSLQLARPLASDGAQGYEVALASVAPLGTAPWLRQTATAINRVGRDAWDVVRWTRCPFEPARAILPLPERWMSVRVLNEGGATGEPTSASVLGGTLGTLKNLLRSEIVVDGRVDYRRLPNSGAFGELVERSRLLTQIVPESFRSDSERISFWLNLYNVLAIHGVVAFRIRESVMEVPSFFLRTAYRVGQHVFVLDDMSNGVLRRAGRRPSSGRRQFRDGDARMAYCPGRVDARIHGALVCAADSCPPVAFYAAERLDEQLDAAAEHFVRQFVRVDEQRRLVHLPLQFYYYAQDFGGQGGITRFILRYLPELDRPKILRACAERWRIRWDPYHWALNAGV